MVDKMHRIRCNRQLANSCVLRLLIILPVVVLLFAAGAKTHAAMESWSLKSIPSFGLAIWEFAIGVLLLLWPFERKLVAVAFITYSMFSITSTIRLASGQVTCGCFGAVVAPLPTVVALDLAFSIISAIWFFRAESLRRSLSPASAQ